MGIEQARREASEEAHRRFEMELEMKLVEERARTERIRLEFARDRQRFFSSAESQVVKLALAVARKVLQHEASTDGLYLRSSVKAALARVQDGTTTTLRVPEREFVDWTAMFLQAGAERVQVVIDEQMKAGECVLETKVGTIEFGLEVQLGEVERGFHELTQEQGH